MERSNTTIAHSRLTCVLLLTLAATVVNVWGDSRVRFRLAGDIAEAAAQNLNNPDSETSVRQDYSADFRYIFERKAERWSFDFHGLGLLDASNIHRNPDVSGSIGRSTSEPGRALNLSTQLNSSRRHSIGLLVDQLRFSIKSDRWRVMVGRMPVFWGRGVVYQPLDVFNAHPPTTIDREFKAGNDSLVIERLFRTGAELQFLSILRDNSLSNAHNSSTVAIKSYFPIAEHELEFIAGKHYDETILGMSTALPLGGVLLRTDIAATCADGCWRSVVVNADYSFGVRGGILYTFVEYYYNGLGVSKLSEGLRDLPTRLTTGIQRGEVFAYGKHVLAAGSSVTWHPLWNQSLTVLANLHDRSFLFQSFVNYLPTDNNSFSFGVRVPFGGRNEEFGTLEVDENITVGGQIGVFFELSHYR